MLAPKFYPLFSCFLFFIFLLQSSGLSYIKDIVFFTSLVDFKDFFQGFLCFGGVGDILTKQASCFMAKQLWDDFSKRVENTKLISSLSLNIAAKCIDSILKTEIIGVLCKLNVEKAYDHVNWGFLMYMPQRCRFSEKWRKWIVCCISTVKFSILINGSPSDFFGSSREIRQGDPFSLLIFDVVMEALSHMLEVAATAGQFSRFYVHNTTGTSMIVSHLLFADNTLIFCYVDPNHSVTLREILTRFEGVSGLRINLRKSKLVPVEDMHNLDDLIGLLGCRHSSLPLKYLGLPLGAKFKELSI